MITSTIQPPTFFINSRRILYCYFFNTLELLAVHTRFFYTLLMSWRTPVFTREIHLAAIKPEEKVLQIGCGIFPTETILLAQLTQATVVGIDNSTKAVRLARAYVCKNGLEKTITITEGDGSIYPVESFDVIFIAINVFPIDTVLLHLAKKMKKGGRVVCKSLKYDIPLVLDRLHLSTVFSIETTVENPKSQSYLLKKQV